MDTLHTVLRAICGETKSRRDHHSVFREFLDHLGRITQARGKDERWERGRTETKTIRRGK